MQGLRVLAHVVSVPAQPLAHIMKTSHCSIRASIRALFIQKYKSNSFCQRVCVEIALRSLSDRRLAGASHRQALDFQRGLTNADRNTLTFLTTRAHAIVESQVVPDHGDPC
jgi:hypothetical protein